MAGIECSTCIQSQAPQLAWFVKGKGATGAELEGVKHTSTDIYHGRRLGSGTFSLHRACDSAHNGHCSAACSCHKVANALLWTSVAGKPEAESIRLTEQERKQGKPGGKETTQISGHGVFGLCHFWLLLSFRYRVVSMLLHSRLEPCRW